MKKAYLKFGWLIPLLFFLMSKTLLAQQVDFSSDYFISHFYDNHGLTFCADSASNIYVYDENGVLLTSYYLTGPGCVEMLFDSATMTNGNNAYQLDKNRFLVQTEVKGAIYATSSQNSYSLNPFYPFSYPRQYSMNLIPPPTIAGTANIRLGYNYSCNSNVFPYLNQLIGNYFDVVGINDTTRLTIYPGGYHPFYGGQSSYSVRIAPDELWRDGMVIGSASPIFPQYYPSAIVDQDSTTYPKGKFLLLTGLIHQPICISNPWIIYNSNFMFYPLAYEFLGASYHTIPHATRLGDSLMAFSFHDGTILNVNGFVDTLDKGEIYRTLIDTPAVWTANHPFSLIQISRQSAQDSVFQSAMFAYSVHPDEALLTYAWYPSEIIDDTIPNQQSYLNLLSPSNGVNSVLLDGVSLAAYFQPYGNDSSWSWAQIPVASSLHKLQADSGVIAYAYQYGESCGAGFNVGGLRMKNQTTSSISSYEKIHKWSLYPNPAGDYVNITHLSAPYTELNAIVIASDGEIVLSSKLSPPNYRLDISGLSAGLYILRLSDTSKNSIGALRFTKVQ